MKLIRDAMNGLQMGEVLHHEGLALFPLTAGDKAVTNGRDYMVLDEALEKDLLDITEVDEHGSVPDLKVRNRAKKPVLILDGEELVGAKQNRILDITVLVPADQEILIPVSCVEQGRWHSVGRRFSSAKHLVFGKMRAAKKRRMMDARRRGERGYDQQEVWHDVRASMVCLSCNSDTEALNDVYSSREVDLDGYVRALAPQDGQLGAVFSVGGRVIGMELFDHPKTFRLFLPKVIRSYAMDALMGGGGKAKKPRPEEAEQFLHQMALAEAQPILGVGLGEFMSVRGKTFDGSALSFQGRVVHLSAFAQVAG